MSPSPSRPGDRESQFELLRIALILAIVVGHLLMHGAGLSQLESLRPGWATAHKLFYLSLVLFPVNGFVLISGYFGVRLKLEKALTFWLQCATYSVGIVLLFRIFGKATTKDLLLSPFPLSQTSWWFATCYFFLMLGSPFLNRLAELPRPRFQFLLALLAVAGIVMHVFPAGFLLGGGGASLSHFVFLYLLGRYLRRFEVGLGVPRAGWLAVHFGCGLAIFGIAMLLVWLRRPSGLPLLVGYNNPLLILQAVAVLFWFRTLRLSDPWINKLGSMGFAVYLVHDHPLVRGWIYKHLFVIDRFAGGFALGLFLLLFAALIYALGSAVESVRLGVMARPLAALRESAGYRNLERRLRPYLDEG